MKNKHLVKTILIVSSDDKAFLTHRLPIANAAKDISSNCWIICKDTGQAGKIRKCGFNVITLKDHSAYPGLLSAILTTLELKSVYQQKQPEIIHHSSVFISFLGGLASLFAQEPKYINAVTGVGYLFSSNSMKARILRLALTPIMRALWSRRRQIFLFQNANDKELFVKKGFGTPSSAIIPGSGVDINKFTPAKKRKFRKNKIIISCASRLIRDKGLEELIQAIASLPAHMNVELHIAGDIAKSNLQASIIKKLKKWKNISSVKFLGQVEDMRKFWHNCDIAILASHREGLPKSLLEAAACGLPLLGANVPGTRELIDDGVNGYLFEKGNSEDIARCILNLIQDKIFFDKAGLESRKKIENGGFSNEAVAKAYKEFILSI